MAVSKRSPPYRSIASGRRTSKTGARRRGSTEQVHVHLDRASTQYRRSGRRLDTDDLFVFVARFSLVHNVFDEKPEIGSAGWIGVQPHLVALLDFGAGTPLRDLDREQVENAVHVLGLCVDLGRELCQLIENPDQEVSSRDVTLMVLGVGDVEVGQRGDEVFARPVTPPAVTQLRTSPAESWIIPYVAAEGETFRILSRSHKG